MPTAPTFRQIRTQFEAIRRKLLPQTRAMGIRSTVPWTGERLVEDGGELFLIKQCDSPLAMRQALRDPDAARAFTVLVTGLDEADLSEDILLRLARRQLFPLDSWQTILTATNATAIDPRLMAHRWLADSLGELAQSHGSALAPGRFLDAETVWPLLLRTRLGLAEDRPDLTSILRWSTDPASVARFRGESPQFRDAVRGWLADRAGPAAEAVLRVVAEQERPDAVPIGLAMGVIYHPEAVGRLERAIGRFEERYLDGQPLDPEPIRRWASAATEVVRLQLADTRLKGGLLQRADEILREVGGEACAALSPTSPLGFDRLLARFGSGLKSLLDQRRTEPIGPLQAIRDQIAAHDQAGRERVRIESLDMAIRLLRWLATPNAISLPTQGSLADAAREEAQEGGFVDWARLRLIRGDRVPELSTALGCLFDRVTEVREQQARRFANLLQEWTRSDHRSPDLCPVEAFLDQYVAPLARHKPVLVIVMDGMSHAVCRELLPSLVGHDWLVLNPAGQVGQVRPGLAAIPSVTEVSRTSLLCGRLLAGSHLDEAPGFAEHPALRAASQGSRSPVLYHKSALSGPEDANLDSRVRTAIGETSNRIVGVVVNAIDDQLGRGDQVDHRWSRDSIPLLVTLLSEAKSARRLVILTSDHGHIVERKTQQRQQPDAGERWYPASGEPAADECKISGRRVVKPVSKVLIAPWSEAVRYSLKKFGYHGGANPQEMVTPIVVLSPSDDLPEGWDEAPSDQPAWWVSQAILATPTAAEAPAAPVRPKQETMFGSSDTPPRASGRRAATPDAEPIWLTLLLRSSLFDDQRKRAGRAVLGDALIRSTLAELDRRGGRATVAALSHATGHPATRMSGLVAVLQRILNIDGFGVLTRDDASDTIELNRELLKRQFELESPES